MFDVDPATTNPAADAGETDWRKRRIADMVLVAISGMPQRLVVPAKVDCEASYVLVSRTAGSIETNGRSFDLTAPSAYIVDPRCEHVLTVLEGLAQLPVVTHFFVVIPPALSGPARASLRASGGLPLRRLEAGSAALFAALVEAAYEHASAIASHVAPIVAQSIVELLNAALAEAAIDTEAPAHGLELHHRMRIYEHAAKELTDHELSVASIAAAVGLSVRRVHQVFASAEMPLMHWVWSERLAKCHGRLLAGTHRGQTIGDIAYEWGFNDPAHFSRVFRKRYGHAPSHYVKQTTPRAIPA